MMISKLELTSLAQLKESPDSSVSGRNTSPAELMANVTRVHKSEHAVSLGVQQDGVTTWQDRSA